MIPRRRKEYILTADLPGLDKKDLSVRAQNGVLTISGERKADRDA